MHRRTFLSLAAASVASPASAADPKEKVRIVSSLPRTGAAKTQAGGIVNAIKMALADFEKDVPFEVELVDRDNADAKNGYWSAEKEAENARIAAEGKDVVAYVGPYHSGAAKVSMPVLNRAGLVQVSPAASWPGLTRRAPSADPDEPEKYRPAKRITFCRVCPNDATQGPFSADFAADELKAKSVYVLDDKELYGLGVASLFQKRCEERKVKVLGRESVRPKQSDFTDLLKKIKEKNPDLIYFGGTTATGGGRIARAMKAEGVECPLLAPDGCYEQAFIASAGKDALEVVKCFVTAPGINPADLKGRGAEFVNRYKEKYGQEPGYYAPYGYEAAAVILAALRAAGKNDREAIRKAVVGTKDFDGGVLGEWRFDPSGDTTHQPLTVTTVEDGKFKLVKVMGVK